MAAGRTLKSLIGRRRRAEDEGEDDDGPVMVEDSQSEGSVLTDAEDEEGDGSSLGGAAGVEDGAAEAKAEASTNGSKTKKSRKSKKKGSKKSKDAETELSQSQIPFAVPADTEAMMNGLKITEERPAQDKMVDFDNVDPNGTAQAASGAANGHVTTPAERQRREHEEYKKKRDSDPAFIPNRGNFFMHDTRGQQNGQPPPPRGAWQGRGRGRGGMNVGGPFSPANQQAQAERSAEQLWKHDLHDTINEEPHIHPAAPNPAQAQHESDSSRLFPKQHVQPNQAQPPVISFSSTTLVGKVQIRVLLPGMKTPITFSEVPWKHYIRLPDHRPPLRRDKPVRVSLPGHPQRYIFPATDRSFIFIPRQMRPNQQGFNRGNYQRSIGGYGYSSRRTSMYGGSVYSGSVAPSRRSSMAGMSRENAFSPVGSFVGMQPNRPVVRLPHGAQQHFSAVSTPIGPLSGHQTPTSMPQVHSYPLPQEAPQYNTPTTSLHQPRPQKAISVTGIESPMLQQTPHEAQPFQGQLPSHMNEQANYPQQPPPPYFSPRQQYQHPQPQPQTGTPLSGIPEQAVHAPNFQPPQGYGPAPPYYAAYPPQQGYYYPHPAPNGYQPMHMYMMPAPPHGYMVPPPPPPPSIPNQAPPPPQQPPSQPNDSQQQHQHGHQQQSSQSGLVARELNGMVFYVPTSEARQSELNQAAESFVPSYAMPGLPPPTPAPDSSMEYYYPPMQGMQEVGSAVYYPAQPQP